MKNILVLLALVLGSTSVFADAEWGNLPTITEPSIRVWHGPPMAAVQPAAFLRFKFRSCTKQVLEIEIEERDGLNLVSVIHPEQSDCPGPMTERNYELQLSSDYSFFPKNIVVNPLY